MDQVAGRSLGEPSLLYDADSYRNNTLCMGHGLVAPIKEV